MKSEIALTETDFFNLKMWVTWGTEKNDKF